ncbi:M20 family metallo-hydrolase [Thioclava sp.]|uniref:M20 family metallo-hydrolase n=1 Tax=Thioclava sp. TaxID=1933450 RepID=UPI003AA7F051
MINESARMTHWGDIARERLEIISMASEAGPGVTRLPFSEQYEAAIGFITSWMTAAGCAVHLDAAGTLVGRRAGPKGAGTLLIGSHQDSVRQGGCFDGIMGVALGCLALEKLAQDRVELPFAVEILAFADEEGVRFPTALMGPRALAGTLDPAVFAMTDNTGQTLSEALAQIGGNSKVALKLTRDNKDIFGFLEVHIEQGPVLESLDAPLGVVTAISGIERHSVQIFGEAGHAGTVPMTLRKDALRAGAKLVEAVHDLALRHDLRATVGALTVSPNVVNAIPAQVDLTVEIRAPNDETREAAGVELAEICAQIASETGTQIEQSRSYAQPAVACDPKLRALLSNSVAQVSGQAPDLPSGATHDASAMADLCPVAMLFVRCRGGISHSPAEYASNADMGAAVDALALTLATYNRAPEAEPVHV